MCIHYVYSSICSSHKLLNACVDLGLHMLQFVQYHKFHNFFLSLIPYTCTCTHTHTRTYIFERHQSYALFDTQTHTQTHRHTLTRMPMHHTGNSNTTQEEIWIPMCTIHTSRQDGTETGWWVLHSSGLLQQNTQTYKAKSANDNAQLVTLTIPLGQQPTPAAGK